MSILFETFLKRVKVEKSVKIYGAGKFAKTLCYLFDRNNIKVDAFVVTDLEGNPSELLHRPVIGLGMLLQEELCDFVIGVEKSEDMKKITNFLLARRIKNIIMVPPNIVNDIYCNFIIDQKSKFSFCKELAKRKNVIAYINDPEGEYIVHYLRSNGIEIGAIYTDLADLTLKEDIPVFPYNQMAYRDLDSTVVLTMNNIYWQRTYITRLRKVGFENIVLLSEKIMKEMKKDYLKLIWKEMNAGFSFVETNNIEENFYKIQNKQGENIYCWRIANWDKHFYQKEVLEYIKSGKMVAEYESRYSGFSFLSYKEAPLCEIENKDLNIEVYMVKCHVDKKSEKCLLPDWIMPIQAGKALTDIKIAEICDDTGDNISLKNMDYSEGTALYWIWKNTSGQDYIGLFHYRRQIALGRDSLEILTRYDVLLTVPTFTSMPIKQYFCEFFILEHDWNIMIQYIKEYDRTYYETALQYEKGKTYFPCNIFIMRRKYFDEMCEFIFEVLEKIDNYYKNIPMMRGDRYLGYILECLLSIYMMHNAGKLKAVYTDMKYYPPMMEDN